MWPITRACEQMINGVLEKYKHIDILVNNAGITRDNLLMKMSEEEFDAVIDTNLKGTFHTMRFVSRQMLKQRAGRIINLASVVGIVGNAGQTNYAASKAGVIGMTKTAAKELAARGITVNAIAPGFIETDMTDKLSEKIREADECPDSAGTFWQTGVCGEGGGLSGFRRRGVYHRTGTERRRRHGNVTQAN